APPKFSLRGLHYQVRATRPEAACSDSHAMRADIVCRTRPRKQRPRHSREEHLKLLGITRFLPDLTHGGQLRSDRRGRKHCTTPLCLPMKLTTDSLAWHYCLCQHHWPRIAKAKGPHN